MQLEPTPSVCAAVEMFSRRACCCMLRSVALAAISLHFLLVLFRLCVVVVERSVRIRYTKLKPTQVSQIE